MENWKGLRDGGRKFKKIYIIYIKRGEKFSHSKKKISPILSYGVRTLLYKKMAYTIIKKLPTVEELHQKFPLTEDLKIQVQNDITDIQNILSGKDERKILIVGPCSAWPQEAVLEYAKALLPLKEAVKDVIKIVLRVYIQKPRTTVGWVGPVNQPNPYADPDLTKGFEYCRKMMLEVIKMGYAIADEAVYTHKKGYFTDLYSWIAIGARSAEDQEHRLFASMLDCPVGMKNPTSGDLITGVNSVIAAQYAHTFAIEGDQITTGGNAYAHLILRGGGGKRNSDLESMLTSSELITAKKLQNPSLIVDISHDNSLDPATGKKNPLLQPEILMEVVQNMQENKILSQTVKGFMIESFLNDGAQNMNACTNESELEYGTSITDGCIGLKKTEIMIRNLAKKLR